jgi:hypothetical protein
LRRKAYRPNVRDDSGDDRRSPAVSRTLVRMTASELALFIEGCELVGRRRLSPDAVVPTALGG